jgi:hypothetical protein
MTALNSSHDPRFKSGSSIERMSCHIDDLTTALRMCQRIALEGFRGERDENCALSDINNYVIATIGPALAGPQT